MGKLLGIAGDEGSGKTASTENLDLETSFYMTTFDKELSYGGSNRFKEYGNYFVSRDYVQICRAIKKIDKDKPEVKVLVLDDIGFSMYLEYWKRGDESGYSKFDEIGMHMARIIMTASETRPDLTIVFLWHTDPVYNKDKIISYKLKLIGKQVENKLPPAAFYTCLFWTDVTYDDDGKPIYKFITGRTMQNEIEIKAKSPKGMFNELKIDNDLSKILARMDEFYSPIKQ